MDGYATLNQLLHAPAGAVLTERRGAHLSGVTLEGAPTQAEYRTAHLANPGLRRAQTVEQFLRELEATLTEPLFEG